MEIYTAMGDHKGSEADLPSSDFAKAVRQLIEIHPKIKQIYSENRKGVVMQVFPIWQKEEEKNSNYTICLGMLLTMTDSGKMDSLMGLVASSTMTGQFMRAALRLELLNVGELCSSKIMELSTRVR